MSSLTLLAALTVVQGIALRLVQPHEAGLILMFKVCLAACDRRIILAKSRIVISCV